MNKRIRAIVPGCIARQGQRQEYQVGFEENVERESNRAPDEAPHEQEFSFRWELSGSLGCSSHVDVD